MLDSVSNAPWWPGALVTARSLLEAAVALGFVIFVHELGHFLVAKLCGVKCEKFFLGFDVGGKKICSFTWGETEYGIGVLPLGGYVKMLGQDDNPARDAEERRKAQAHVAAVEHPGDLPHEPTADGAEPLDPRSYLAQSVPERMAIISAGVIMNLIFAVIFAAVAYRCGVRYIPCVIGSTSPGDPAWVAGIRPGDKIVQFDDEPKSQDLRFDYDLKTHVIFSGSDQSLKMGVRRYDSGEIDEISIQPTASHKEETDNQVIIGVTPAASAKLGDVDGKGAYPPDSPAARATPPFKPNDVVVGATIDGVNYPVPDGVAGVGGPVQHPDKPITFTVERAAAKDEPAPEKPEDVRITVEPWPVRHLGLVMQMGEIIGVQKGSPAEKAGFKEGDSIVSVNGQPAPDPLRLPDEMRKLAGQTVTIEVRRGEAGHEKTVALHVVPRPPMVAPAASRISPGSCDALGIAYIVSNRLQSVEPGVPPDVRAKLQAGDEIVSVAFAKRSEDEIKKDKENGVKLLTDPVKFDSDHHFWPFVQGEMQESPTDAEVEVKLLRGDKEIEVTLQPIDAKDWSYPMRGLAVEGYTQIRQANSWGEAWRLGLRETKESAMQIVKTLRGLFTGRVSVSSFGGPGTIAVVATATASAGIPRLLIFLTLLSANLAVLNFLPIPILDGGHMMFLLYEGIRGKPASERAMSLLTYVGLLLILMLIVLVVGLDLKRLFKWLFG